jgi:hypothetical protein
LKGKEEYSGEMVGGMNRTTCKFAYCYKLLYIYSVQTFLVWRFSLGDSIKAFHRCGGLLSNVPDNIYPFFSSFGARSVYVGKKRFLNEDSSIL